MRRPWNELGSFTKEVSFQLRELRIEPLRVGWISDICVQNQIGERLLNFDVGGKEFRGSAQRLISPYRSSRLGKPNQGGNTLRRAWDPSEWPCGN